MNNPAQSVFREALRLAPVERAALAETLISSLDRPDPALDALWLREAESRMAAYRAGTLEAVDAGTVFESLDKAD